MMVLACRIMHDGSPVRLHLLHAVGLLGCGEVLDKLWSAVDASSLHQHLLLLVVLLHLVGENLSGELALELRCFQSVTILGLIRGGAWLEHGEALAGGLEGLAGL